ncbi:MAG: ISAzo13-like element transposase-related protein [Methylococcales bacterium]
MRERFVAGHKPKVEDKAPGLLADIQTIMDRHSQAEPRLRTTVNYTNRAAQAVYDALLAKGWTKDSLATVRTPSNILNRQDDRLRTVAKTKVQKNSRNRCHLHERSTDEYSSGCRSCHTENQRADSKATVPIGEYSRGGQSRGRIAVEALAHDMHPKEKPVPGGILESVTGKTFWLFGRSNEPSDFMVDGLLLWREERKSTLSMVKQLVINRQIMARNVPGRRRSQFLLRMTEFADRTGFAIKIVYYPSFYEATIVNPAFKKSSKIFHYFFISSLQRWWSVICPICLPRPRALQICS